MQQSDPRANSNVFIVPDEFKFSQCGCTLFRCTNRDFYVGLGSSISDPALNSCSIGSDPSSEIMEPRYWNFVISNLVFETTIEIV